MAASSALTPTSRTGLPGVEALQHLERGRFQRRGVGRRLRQRHAAGLRRERREPHLDPHARGGPALGPHVLGDAVGERHGGRAHVRPVGEVGREGLLPPVRARDPRLAAHLDPADPAPQLHVPGAQRGPELGGERLRVGRGELVHGGDPALGELRRGLRADAPQRPRRPVPHHLDPVLRGEREPAARLAELGRDLGAQQVVADPHRAGQPRLRQRRRPGSAAPAPPGRRPSWRRRTPRPSPAPRPSRRRSRAAPPSPAPTPPRTPACRRAGTRRPGSACAAVRSGIPDRTPYSRAT